HPRGLPGRGRRGEPAVPTGGRRRVRGRGRRRVTALLVALGAALGAPLRYAIASALDAERFPRGTLLVNVVGSFLLGLFVEAGASGHWLALLGTGFCG